MAEVTADAWDAFARALAQFRTKINRNKSAFVNKEALQTEGRSLVQQYFRNARPDLQSLGFADQDFSDLDAALQDLLRLAQGKNRTKSYVAALQASEAAGRTITANRELRYSERALASRAAGPPVSSIEALIVSTLDKLVPSAGLSYRQALLDLHSTERVSFRGTANELRECLREVIDHLAPEETVRAASGFKPEPNQTRATQKQRVRWLLKSRQVPATAARVPEDALDLVDTLTAAVARSAMERSNLSAHVSTARGEVQRMKLYVDSVLAELLSVHRG